MDLAITNKSHVSDADTFVVCGSGFPGSFRISDSQLSSAILRNGELPESITVTKEVHLSMQANLKRQDGARYVTGGFEASLLVYPPSWLGLSWHEEGWGGDGGVRVKVRLRCTLYERSPSFVTPPAT